MSTGQRLDGLSDSQRDEIHRIRGQFVQQLRENRNPSIESQLAVATESIRRPLFVELLKIELEHQSPSDATLASDNYEARFPNFKNEIGRAIAGLPQCTVASANTNLMSGSDTPQSPLLATTGPVGLASGVQIGPYKLLQPVGEGGMGTVWMAEQKQPVRRIVALKVIKVGMDTREVIARFEAERQALALMSHPNIARVLDAGATETGRPYFAMEYVKGEPITKFCDGKKLGTDQRIELFMDVCRAVQHAHQRGIIHRDIKPSNVMVSMNGDDPLVKVIDFGLAKAFSQKLTEKTIFTAVGQVVGTPAYMSPEQVETGGLEVDTRTDVYSLGVLLYELLTGVTPLDLQKLRSAGYAKMIEMIREQDPPRMSQRLSSLGADSDTTASNRSTDIKRLNRRLQGDLDVIVMCALAKEPSRRYSTPNDFADDLNRFLGRQPIEARPASAIYRLKKLAERNKGKFVAAGLLMLALVGGFIGTALGLFEAKRQTEIAQKNLVTAEENYELARDAVDSYFTSVSDNQLLNEPYMDGLRRELLNSARTFYQKFVDRRQDDSDALIDLATAHLRLGGISAKMGDHEQAMIEYEACRNTAIKAAQGTSQTLYPGESERLQLECDIYVGESFVKKGEYAAAIKNFDTAIEMARAAAENYPDSNVFKHKTAIFYLKRGETYVNLNQQEAAEKDYRSGVEILDKLATAAPDFGSYTRDLATTFERLGTLIYEQERFPEAEECFNKSIEIWRKKIKENKDSVDSQHGLADSLILKAFMLRRNGEHAEAVKLGEESVKIGRDLVANHPELITLQNSLIGQLGNLSVVYKVAGKQQLADALNLEVMQMLETMRTKFPNDVFHSLRLGSVQGNEGNSKFSAGEYQEAIDWFDRANETLEILLTKSAGDPRARLIVRNNHWGRADAFTKLERYGEAIAAFDATLEMAEERARPQIQLERALMVIKNGNYAAAAKTVKEVSPNINMELLTRKSNVAINWFKAGSVLAEAADAAEKDPDLDEEQKAARLKEFRMRAIAALRKAHEFGHFEKPKSQPLRTDRFSSLSESPEFQELLSTIDAVPSEEGDSGN